MSTQTDGALGLPSTPDIARRLRQYMGDYKISRARLALSTGISRSSLGKKLDAEVQFTIEELAAVCFSLDVEWVWLTTGMGNPRQDGPDGGGESAPSRTRTYDLRIKRSDTYESVVQAAPRFERAA